MTCITTAGVFPGLSNLLAADLIERGNGADEVRFRYFMAGSNGFGLGVMVSSVNGAITPCVDYIKGERVVRAPFGLPQREMVDFGAPIGPRDVYPFELPETTSIQQVFNVPTVTARFGTGPPVFNWLSWFTGLAGGALLRSSHTAQAIYGRMCYYMTLAIDPFVGERFGMRIDVFGKDGTKRTHVSTYESGVKATGIATSWQVLALLHHSSKMPRGVLFPEEAIVGETRNEIVARARKLADTFSVSESKPTAHDEIQGPSVLDYVWIMSVLTVFLGWPYFVRLAMSAVA